jgi:hypothetical protein
MKPLRGATQAGDLKRRRTTCAVRRSCQVPVPARTTCPSPRQGPGASATDWTSAGRSAQEKPSRGIASAIQETSRHGDASWKRAGLAWPGSGACVRFGPMPEAQPEMGTTDALPLLRSSDGGLTWQAPDLFVPPRSVAGQARASGRGPYAALMWLRAETSWQPFRQNTGLSDTAHWYVLPRVRRPGSRIRRSRCPTSSP